ncbi:methionine ABC transporter ATP-binding protein [Cohnella thailandensis]|uniref:ATP-binding cassette domain-containing protein n=1 Tax=Cohnella thailandensis TaxID=557557 RepID=A0A841T665_9BACL|nr:ATP-binding cassette domain-containing protein [Cohnella thailandensis]MBB6637798.1 ATP-binding cassette domain-containing protein [Cohnella thailandensis]MBP1974023.1 D-methionine transport system ATP-binding protein [Cohnella thailandensis]
MIEILDVRKTFTRGGLTHEALKGVTLRVGKGDIYGIIGTSGAGKSTLIRLVNALEKPTSGRVLVEGQPLDGRGERELRAAKKKIGMVFQHFNLLESKTVFDNVAIPLVLDGKGKKEIRERVLELLAYVGLSDKAKSYPKELSGGQKQRVGIARALANNPTILLCDEATSALDPQTTQSILALLKRINEEFDITILIVTHEMAVIQQICNKVAVMQNGEIIEQGYVLNVFGRPEHPTTENFVRTVIRNTIPGSVLNDLNRDRPGRVFKLEFVGDSASQPIISRLVRSFDVEINILFANMTEVQQTTLGNMTLQIVGADREIEGAIAFLKEQVDRIEEVEAI